MPAAPLASASPPSDDATLSVVRRIVAERSHLAGPLLPILHGVQSALGHLPRQAVPVIAAALNLSRAEVHGVISYYHDFREQPVGRSVVQVCRAESCQAMGADALLAQARRRLACSEASPTSADGAWTVEPAYCLGLCASSPAVRIGSGLHARMTPARLDAALQDAGLPDPALRGQALPGAPLQDPPLQDPPRHDRPRQDRPLQDRPRQDAARQAAVRHGAAPPNAALPWRTSGTRIKVCVPRDSAARAVGADAVAAAIVEQCAARGIEIELVRTSSRGLFWLEPLLEVETNDGRIGYGPVEPGDVAGLLDAGALQGGGHALCLGRVEDIDVLKRQRRLTFSRAGVTDPLSLADYESHGGWAGLHQATRMTPADLWQQVLDSGLRGRGGAAFPAGIKWRTVALAAAAQKYIVCNADEGDSGTFADRMVLEGDPYLLIEGMAIAALACGATRGFVYIRSEYADAVEVFGEAIDRARSAGFLGPDVLGSGRAFELEVRMGAGSYVCGEETAMLESIEGRRGIVRAKPPVPALAGLFGKPTLIQNVLTFAAVPGIVGGGAEAYRQLGHGRSSGTQPFQLAGNIRHGGLVELAFGVTLRELLHSFGGGTASGRPIKAVQVGGPLGTYVPEAHWDVPLDYEAYAAIGAVVGHGGIVVHDDTADLAKLARYAMEFCALESCGKCTPCRIGSTRGVEVIDRIVGNAAAGMRLPDMPGKLEQVVLLRDLCDTMLHGSLCAMGGMTPLPVLSALDHYPADFGLPAHERAAVA